MAISTKLYYQGIILDRFPELVKKYRKELCEKCGFSALGHEGCDEDLLPVDINGNPCPYQVKRHPGAARPMDPYKILMGRR